MIIICLMAALLSHALEPEINLEQSQFGPSKVKFTNGSRAIKFDIFDGITQLQPNYKLLGQYAFTTGNTMYYTNDMTCGVSVEVVVLDFKCGPRLEVVSETFSDCVTTFEMRKVCAEFGIPPPVMENDIELKTPAPPEEETEIDYEDITVELDSECAQFECSKKTNNTVCGRIRQPKNQNSTTNRELGPLLSYPNNCFFRQTRCVLRKKAEKECSRKLSR